MPVKRDVTIAPTTDELKNRLEVIITAAWNNFKKNQQKTVDESNKFTIGLSGGSLIDLLTDVLPRINVAERDGAEWVFYFVDERLVEATNSESTFGCYVRKLLPKVNYLNVSNFVSLNNYLFYDPTLVAKDYEDKMRRQFTDSTSYPSLDLILLGMGPDGHTASLFPNHPLLKEDKVWIAPITDSPKPPPQRVTMTLPLINHGKVVVVVSTGSSKAEMVSRVVKNDPTEDIPVSLVNPSVNGGTLELLLDADAGKLVN